MSSIPELIKATADRLALRADIIAAIVQKESRGNPWATRYEPGFYDRHLATLDRKSLSGYVPPNTPTLETEKRDRATSFGLCQILGETARSQLGVRFQFLSELLDPAKNIDACGQYLLQLYGLFPGVKPEERWFRVLERYNGSGPAARQYAEAAVVLMKNGEHRRWLL